ncbi:tyrosine-type recombinase/integrase [Burkholderia pseudomallei]|uniref:tyrosine-type recombinase/integrase n=1 Tax=Burkholderia pseudomallei TaxID=28450 RepID=UPI002DB7DBE1|nr:tyrosine-type recombinase/integrase [Burkholderia pseudomallei]MEB5483931.1 tyrosine-type recombinase/integrase [Burkholderia pseudomallei]MEB5490814.1 tyrosine-type recombinase/integrase [Burkholderia pseudomallei]MEB5497481.1 tyrosine-type recombinase/integrase [Burkholderia pseudomallei]MEB5502788.1 tyrosine-type recombinase/integrase [Burkholderia pseudomallei]MEB5510168.1 tyrosine-type recombinase/integrase [Burkholderia pseudomallei]
MAARRRNADRRNWPANLYQNSAGYFWYKNTVTGKSYGLGRDFKVASAQARTANAELLHRAGDVALINRIDGGTLTLDQWCDRYLEKFEASGKASNTIKSVQSQIRAIKAAPFSNQSLMRVSTKEINDYIESITESRGATITAKIRSRLQDVFRSAEAAGHIELGKNPAIPVKAPPVDVSRDRLTLDDFNAIVAKTREDSTRCWAANAFELALLTGQRLSDIAAMTFDQVKDGFLWVEPIKSQGKVKLKIPVHVGLSSVKLTIEAVIKRCRDSVVSKHMVHFIHQRGSVKPGQKVYHDTISKTFAEMRDVAGITGREGKNPPSFHEIRSLAIRLYSDEYGPAFAQALVGHSSAQMTALYRDNRGREWTEVKLAQSK